MKNKNGNFWSEEQENLQKLQTDTFLSNLAFYYMYHYGIRLVILKEILLAICLVWKLKKNCKL